jgi:uncharacterized protein YutE (UPF0331/DUF86 family)
LEKLTWLATIPRQEFLSDFTKIASAKYLLQISIECCLDVAHHIIAREQFRAPKDYVESFEILVEREILPEKFMPDLRQMVRIRNRLVHLYWEIDEETIYDEILQHDLEGFDTFVKHVLSYFEIQ